MNSIIFYIRVPLQCSMYTLINTHTHLYVVIHASILYMYLHIPIIIKYINIIPTHMYNLYS